ncbi:MAG: hypothetical protein A2038_01405 [Deltaproteobacteria bacterium GWA2_57_13]|nr:MAG: hypothetical protein A2038_01405 [Deltaproteobacteria bacterium GWA2_57_13]
MTIEVIQNRFTQIAREAGLALIRTAASPTPVESKDLGFNIADHKGRTIVYSAWMPRHGTTLSYMLHACTSYFGMEQIFPGDVLLVNDPHAGALHLSDIALIAPVHHKGELVAWVGCATHHMDIGGINPGWSPWVENCYQEGLKFTPIKLMERGELRQDLFDFFLNNVRMPQMQGLDLKAQIAACTVAQRKICELMERYGFKTIRFCYEDILNFSEMKARQKIRALPKLEYRFTDFMDFERLYRIQCALKVREDSLFFDFTGTSPEADTFINAALPCSVANIHNVLTCLLFSGVPANEGCFRPVEIFIPEGTVLNCSRTAPCSGASVLGGWKAQCAAIGVLGQALAGSSEWRRVNALWGWGHPMIILSGQTQKLGRFVRSNLGGSMQGGGARATKDGVNASNIAGSTNSTIPNIESLEDKIPVLFLYRRLRKDSGGPGKFRGGLAGEFMFKPHRIHSLSINAFHIGKWYPALGLHGGYPGATAAIKVKRGAFLLASLQKGATDFASPPGEEKDLSHRSPLFPLGEEDAILAQCHGGGGYGDSLQRDPERVVQDFHDGFISLPCAESVYGVRLTADGGWDHKETERLHLEIQAKRLGKKSTDLIGGLRLGARAERGPFSRVQEGVLLAPQDSCLLCARCGCSLGHRDRPDFLSFEISPSLLDCTPLDAPYRLLGQGCPSCGSLLEVQVEILRKQ